MNLLLRVRHVLGRPETPSTGRPWLAGLMTLALLAIAGGALSVSSTFADDEDKPKRGARDGEGAPQKGPRDGERPKEGPRDGADPSKKFAPRDDGPREPRAAEGGAKDRGIDDFRPENAREAALLKMIQQLQREVAELRAQTRGRQAEAPARPSRESQDGDRPPRESGRRPERGEKGQTDDSAENGLVKPRVDENRALMARAARVFKAYDKDGDNVVTLDEILAMREGASDAIVEREERLLETYDKNGDGGLSLGEFFLYRNPPATEREDGQKNRRENPEGADDNGRAKRKTKPVDGDDDDDLEEMEAEDRDAGDDDGDREKMEAENAETGNDDGDAAVFSEVADPSIED